MCANQIEMSELYQKAIDDRNQRTRLEHEQGIYLDELFKPEIQVVPRSVFSEAKGKQLFESIVVLDRRPQSIFKQLSTKYVALSSLHAIDSFLEKNYGLGIIDKAKQHCPSGSCIDLEYHYSQSFLSLDQKTCISLNLFGEQNSMIKMFSPITEMGRLQLRRRINQPSASTAKIEKWYSILKKMLSISGEDANSTMSELNLRKLLKSLESLGTYHDSIILILKQRSCKCAEAFVLNLIRYGY